MASCWRQREWGQQFKDKSKIVEWPEHNFEHFIVVVSAISAQHLPFCGCPNTCSLSPRAVFDALMFNQGLPPTTVVKAPTADDITRRRGVYIALLSPPVVWCPSAMSMLMQWLAALQGGQMA